MIASRFTTGENSTGTFIRDEETGKFLFCFGAEDDIKEAAQLLNLCHHFFFKQDQPEPPKVLWTIEYVHDPEPHIVFRGQNGFADGQIVYRLNCNGTLQNVYGGQPVWDVCIPQEIGRVLYGMFSQAGSDNFPLT